MTRNVTINNIVNRPGDRQGLPSFAKILKEGRTHFQIGDNTNLFDWTYVGNVAYAHILAADKLVSRSPSMPEKVAEALDTALPSIDLTTGQHRVPTSLARPLGPYVERPEAGDAIVAAFEGPHKPERPVVRSRFDQLSEAALARDGTDPLQVAGQAFFITNGEPVYFWDFPRRLWRMLAPESYPSRDPLVLPKSVGFAVATLAEWWGWLSGREPTFTRFRVTFACVHRWHNIEKARRVLGYEPQVGLEEGMRRTVEVRALFVCLTHVHLLIYYSPVVVESRGGQVFVFGMTVIYPHLYSLSFFCCTSSDISFTYTQVYCTQDTLHRLIKPLVIASTMIKRLTMLTPEPCPKVSRHPSPSSSESSSDSTALRLT
jgi:nucleoside-diphosphate-sugar epimerase